MNMEAWKKALDKYLTTPPDDGFDLWCEEVDWAFVDFFWDKNDLWFSESDGQYNKWLNNLFQKGTRPMQAAKIIERAFNVYNQ